jgi:hypothetical protein
MGNGEWGTGSSSRFYSIARNRNPSPLPNFRIENNLKVMAMRDASLFLRNLIGCEKYGKRPWEKSLVTN